MGRKFGVVVVFFEVSIDTLLSRGGDDINDDDDDDDSTTKRSCGGAL